MTKPAGFTGNGDSSILLPSWSTFTRLDAVISSKKSPYGLMRNASFVPGTRALMCVKTRSSQPNRATSRYAAARSTRIAHSSGETLRASEGMSSSSVLMRVSSLGSECVPGQTRQGADEMIRGRESGRAVRQRLRHVLGVHGQDRVRAIALEDDAGVHEAARAG